MRIVLEIDENRHKSYNPIWELSRVDKLSYGAQELHLTLLVRVNATHSSGKKLPVA